VVILDLSKLDSVCDFFVICTGEVNSQIRAIVSNVERDVRKKQKDRPTHREGLRASNWVILDYVDVVLHVFRPNFRDYYRLEDLWSDGVRADVETDFEVEKFIKAGARKRTVRAKPRKTATVKKTASKTVKKTAKKAVKSRTSP
jgi:ribosome-associated protein